MVGAAIEARGGPSKKPWHGRVSMMHSSARRVVPVSWLLPNYGWLNRSPRSRAQLAWPNALGSGAVGVRWEAERPGSLRGVAGAFRNTVGTPLEWAPSELVVWFHAPPQYP